MVKFMCLLSGYIENQDFQTMTTSKHYQHIYIYETSSPVPSQAVFSLTMVKSLFFQIVALVLRRALCSSTTRNNKVHMEAVFWHTQAV